MVIETCPKCGAKLMNTAICTYPPISCKDCPSCGWHQEGSLETIEYHPVSENRLEALKDAKDD